MLIDEQTGIGNPAILSKFGIELAIDLPGVGENLQVWIHRIFIANRCGEYFTFKDQIYVPSQSSLVNGTFTFGKSCTVNEVA